MVPARGDGDGAALSSDVDLGAPDRIVRCDRIDFPPGGIAYRHTHPGGGIRRLLFGSIHIDAPGHSSTYGSGEAWFEGPDYPVRAIASDSEPTAFVRVMLVPGVGAQGGDVEAVVTNAKTADGTGLVMKAGMRPPSYQVSGTLPPLLFFMVYRTVSDIGVLSACTGGGRTRHPGCSPRGSAARRASSTRAAMSLRANPRSFKAKPRFSATVMCGYSA